MREPIQITIRDLPHSHHLEQLLNKKALKLSTFSDKILSCQVVVELAQKNQTNGKLHSVRVNVQLPNKALLTNSHQDEDLHIAIRETFNGIERQIINTTRELQGHVKAHLPHMQGEVARIFDDGFGFIEANGSEYYFNSDFMRLHEFQKLEIGQRVHFVEVVADSGLQAHHIKVAKRQ